MGTKLRASRRPHSASQAATATRVQTPLTNSLVLVLAHGLARRQRFLPTFFGFAILRRPDFRSRRASRAISCENNNPGFKKIRRTEFIASHCTADVAPFQKFQLVGTATKSIRGPNRGKTFFKIHNYTTTTYDNYEYVLRLRGHGAP